MDKSKDWYSPDKAAEDIARQIKRYNRKHFPFFVWNATESESMGLHNQFDLTDREKAKEVIGRAFDHLESYLKERFTS